MAEDLPDILTQLIGQETLRGLVVERLEGSPIAEIAGFGLSGFLSDAFAEQYVARPFPHLEISLLEGIRRNAQQAFLNLQEVAAANADGGMTLFPLMWLQHPSSRTDPAAIDLLNISHMGFIRAHSGYRLNRILKEAPRARTESFLRGGFRECGTIHPGARLAYGPGTLRQEHVVLVASRLDSENSWPGTTLDPLFNYRKPRCAFTRAEQSVLTRAENEMTDIEIADDLNVSANAVAQRWRSIYTRIGEQLPGFFPANPSTTRGLEKRRRVIAFVRQRPEEMRPFSW
ncbi:MAG: helix-turn-helix transcriptional regulator [Hyphomicrobiaceae bacterium]